MDLEGKVIIGAAAYWQRNMRETITSLDGDYVVTVKDNQPSLHKAAQQSFVIPSDSPPFAKRKVKRTAARCANL